MRNRLAAIGLLLATAAWAQVGASPGVTGAGSSLVTSAGAPSGSCNPNAGDVDTTTGNFYTCNGGSWIKVGPGASVPTTIPVSAQTTSYTVASGDFSAGKIITMSDASAATVTLLATAPTAGQYIYVENIGAGTLTVANNTRNIDGAAANLTLSQNQGVLIVSDGTNYVTNRGIGGAAAVSSVFGRTGAVTATSGDYTAAQVTNAFDVTKANTLTAVAAPTTPATGFGALWFDSTNLVPSAKNASGSTFIMAAPVAAGTHQWLAALGANGAWSQTQPAFSDVSGTATAAQIPNPAGDVGGTYAATTVTGLHFGATGLSLGTAPSSGQVLEYNGTNITGVAALTNPMTTASDTIYGGASGAPTRLAGPTSPNGTPMALTITPSGGVAGTPTWTAASIGIHSQTASYTVASSPASGSSDLGAVIRYTTAPFTVTGCNLGTDAGCSTGFFFYVENDATSGNLTVAAQGTQTVTGDSTVAPGWRASCFADSTTDWLCGSSPMYHGALAGDLSGTLNAPTVAKINGASVPASASLLGSNSSAQLIAQSNLTVAAATTLTVGSAAAVDIPLAVNTPASPTADLFDLDINGTKTAFFDSGASLNVPSAKIGASPPAITIGTAGAIGLAEGTAPTNATGAAAIYADSTKHELLAAPAGSSNYGILERAVASVDLTAQTAAKTTSTLCAASAGACNIAGEYRVDWAFSGSGTACTAVTAGSVQFDLTWTDGAGTTHSAIPLGMFDQKAAAFGTAFNFNTSFATEGASGSFTVYTNGSVIQYATAYTACTTGTGGYDLHVRVSRE